MSQFVFNNYIDFGIFLKVNLEDMLQQSNPNIHEELRNFVNFYENSKGGCGCSIKKRQAAAKSQYLSSIPIIFSDEGAVSFTKATLGSEKIVFNQEPDSMNVLTI